MKKKTGDTEENKAVQIGNNIKKIRQAKGLKQHEVADLAGVNRMTVGNYERGTRIPNAEILQNIAVALGVDINELIKNTHNKIEYSSIKEDWGSWEVKELREKLGEITMENRKLKTEIQEQKSLTAKIIGKLKKLCESIED